jgi:hypothetical protein
VVPVIGEAFGGGYYAGQIKVGGIIYNLIVAPVEGNTSGPATGGSLKGQFGGATAAPIEYKTSKTLDSPTATVQDVSYGGTTSDLFDQDGGIHPLFNWLSSATGPNGGTLNLATGGAGGGTGISGYTDWYIPAKNELEILYRNLKPDSTLNVTSSGANANAVPSATSNYTTTNPARTTGTLFQKPGGAQAFDTGNDYWASTESTADPGDAWVQRFNAGGQAPDGKSGGGNYARAIRRVVA